MGRMPRKRSRPAPRGREAPVASPATAPRDVAPRDVGGGIAAGFLLLAIAAAGLFVDSGADASFDAPKRLATLLCAAAAALAAFGFRRWTNPFAGPSPRRASAPGPAAILFVAACGAALLAAFASPRRALAFDTT